MVATVNASTSAGVVITPDNSGVLAFQSSSATALTIDASQNVGIGTASPTVNLDVNSSAAGGNICAFRSTATNGGYVQFQGSGSTPTTTGYVGAASKLNTGGSVTDFGMTARTNLVFGTNDGTERMRIDSSGNVGIGTTSPWSQISSYGASGATTQYIGFKSADGGDIRFGKASGVDNNAIIGTWGGNPLLFYTNSSERMRIDSSGYLLVGTTVANYLGHNGSNSMNSDGSTHALSLTTDANGFAEGGGGVFPIGVIRSGSSAYVFAGFYSGNGSNSAFSDKEFSFRGDGNGYCDGTWNNNGADYAEYFESANGQALSVGSSVVLDGNKVRESTEQDDQSAIIGVVRPKEPSKASMVIGNTAWNKWANKYLTDDFDRYIMEDHDVLEWTDEDGKTHSYESQNIPSGVTVPNDATRKTHDENGVKFQHYKINSEWNPDAEYVNRENRPEWNIIGLVGQVKLLKDQPVNARWIKMRDVSASVEEWFIR